MSPPEGRQSIIWLKSQLPVSSPTVWVNVPIIKMDFLKNIAMNRFLWWVAPSEEPGLVRASQEAALCVPASSQIPSLWSQHHTKAVVPKKLGRIFPGLLPGIKLLSVRDDWGSVMRAGEKHAYMCIHICDWNKCLRARRIRWISCLPWCLETNKLMLKKSRDCVSSWKKMIQINPDDSCLLDTWLPRG